MPETAEAVDQTLELQETVAAPSQADGPEVAPETPEAATEAPEQGPAEAPDDAPITRAELQELLRQEREQADREAREQERRRIQSENGRKAAQLAAQRAEQEETYARLAQRQRLITDKLRVAAYNMGVPNADAQEMGQILGEAIEDAEPLIRDTAIQQAGRVVSYLANEALGLEQQVSLTAQEELLSQRFRDSLQNYLRSPAVRERLVEEARKEWEMDLDEKIQKGVEAALRVERQGRPGLRQVAGRSGPAPKQDRDSILSRVAYGVDADGNLRTEADKQWYEANILKTRK